jgi:hypothetical protein
MIRIYDSGYRGECRNERAEQIDCISWLKHNYPDRWPLIFHCPGETKASPQHMQMRAKEGVKAGPPDIIDLDRLPGLFELKRLDRTQSKVSKEQKDFLLAGSERGHFAAIVYGFSEFKKAYADYLQFITEKGLT